MDAPPRHLRAASASRDPSLLGETPEEREARKAEWIEENWEAIQSSNEWVAKHGLPLARYRQF
jgi:post-segregation antitoxin (ccd killing protein)